jgi:Na+/proline symporter
MAVMGAVIVIAYTMLEGFMAVCMTGLIQGNAGSWEAPLLAFLASARGAAPEPSP